MRTICTICARGGSRGVPRKNIRNLGGKPLITYSIEQALECEEIDAVYVSTDDEEIAETADQAGALIPFLRPAELATSAAGKLDAILHLVGFLEGQNERFDRIVDLDPTSPLRLADDIREAISLLDDKTDVVITGYPADKNPYFNMVEEKPDGNIGLVCQGDGQVLTRQSAPQVWSMNASIYVWHRHSLPLGLWGGRVRLHEMPHERSVDIDTEIDFKLVELLLNERRTENEPI